jgi:hypothetical protein
MQPEEDIFRVQDTQQLPAKTLFRSGPDSMRTGARGAFGTGSPFVYTPNKQLFLDKQLNGHEQMITKEYKDFWNLVRATYPNEQEFEEIGQKTSYRDETFADTIDLRGLLQKRAIFGRLGTINGQQIIALWPGTNNLPSMVDGLIKELIKKAEVTPEAYIVLHRDPICTVQEFMARHGEMTAKIAADNKAGSALLNSKPNSLSVPLHTPKNPYQMGLVDTDAKLYNHMFRYGENTTEGFKNFVQEKESD